MDKKVQPSSIPLGEAVLAALECAQARIENRRMQSRDKTDMALLSGHMWGLQAAIDIVNTEIGLRMDPPDITYGMDPAPAPGTFIEGLSPDSPQKSGRSQ